MSHRHILLPRRLVAALGPPQPHPLKRNTKMPLIPRSELEHIVESLAAEVAAMSRRVARLEAEAEAVRVVLRSMTIDPALSAKEREWVASIVDAVANGAS